MGKLEDIIESLKDEGRDDDAKELEKLAGSQLRTKAAKADELEAENETLKSQLAEVEAAPKREAAFAKYGVDLEALKPAERDALKAYADDLDDEKIAAFVEKYDLPMAEETEPEEGEEKPAAQQVADAARRAPTKGGGKTTIKPEDVAAWGMDKAVKFSEEHSEEWEALKRGETVTGIPA